MKKEKQENSYNYREEAAIIRDIALLFGVYFTLLSAIIIPIVYIWG